MGKRNEIFCILSDVLYLCRLLISTKIHLNHGVLKFSFLWTLFFSISSISIIDMDCICISLLSMQWTHTYILYYIFMEIFIRCSLIFSIKCWNVGQCFKKNWLMNIWCPDLIHRYPDLILLIPSLPYILQSQLFMRLIRYLIFACILYLKEYLCHDDYFIQFLFQLLGHIGFDFMFGGFFQ